MVTRRQSSGVVDGAIFAFVHGGTNAQMVMLIEARLQDDESARWTVGLGRLNDIDNHVLLDDRQFWSEDSPPRPIPPDYPSTTSPNAYLRRSKKRPPMAKSRRVTNNDPVLDRPAEGYAGSLVLRPLASGTSGNNRMDCGAVRSIAIG